MNLTARDINECLDRVLDAAEPLPSKDLPAGERMVLGGLIFEEGFELVRATSRALINNGELFADLPVDGNEMMEQQRRALGYQALQRLFLKLARRAGDNYLSEQAGVIETAMDVVRQVRAEASQPFPPPRHEERMQALNQAEAALQKRQERKKPGKQRPPGGDGPGPGDPGAPPPPPHPSPQKQAMAEREKLAVDQLVNDWISAHLLPGAEPVAAPERSPAPEAAPAPAPEPPPASQPATAGEVPPPPDGSAPEMHPVSPARTVPRQPRGTTNRNMKDGIAEPKRFVGRVKTEGRPPAAGEESGGRHGPGASGPRARGKKIKQE